MNISFLILEVLKRHIKIKKNMKKQIEHNEKYYLSFICEF